MATDLAGPGYHINRSNLLVLESKADMQKRGQASPDDGDALALTFAHAVAAGEGRARRRRRVRRARRVQRPGRVDAMSPTWQVQARSMGVRLRWPGRLAGCRLISNR
jgi:hypothetical protein